MDNDKGTEKHKNTNGKLERRPSSKSKTAPPVRQTLTSYKRMLKANPLMKYQEAGIDIDELFRSRGNSLRQVIISGLGDSKMSITSEGKHAELKKTENHSLVKAQLPKKSNPKEFVVGGRKSTFISGNQPLTNSYLKKPSLTNSGRTSLKPETGVTSKLSTGNKFEPKRTSVVIKAKVNSLPKKSNAVVNKPGTTTANGVSKPKPTNEPKKGTSTIRRSLSSGHLQSKKGQQFDPKEAYRKSTWSQSEENLFMSQKPITPIGFSPIVEESSGSRNLIFKTPSAYERRSICRFTPRSARKSSVFHASTPAPVEMLRLQERLNKWLKSRGKPLAAFHHLRCFDIDQNKKSSPEHIDEENKENIEVLEVKSESYENLKTEPASETNGQALQDELPNRNDIPEEELAKTAKEAMIELQKLIEEDYPRAQCLGWLELIREKYAKAVDEPEYWECRAAIEQCAGNVGNAVEFYKTAIIQGAEITTVDKSLDQLLKKFSLLNITPGKPEQNKGDGHKERIVREARNVFKSTIIQFAIQERKLKKKNPNQLSVPQDTNKLVVTPVRRSTRLSRSAYVSTPGIKLCSSLKEVNLTMDAIDFERNNALC